jgi:hypothetical protein
MSNCTNAPESYKEQRINEIMKQLEANGVEMTEHNSIVSIIYETQVYGTSLVRNYFRLDEETVTSGIMGEVNLQNTIAKITITRWRSFFTEKEAEEQQVEIILDKYSKILAKQTLIALDHEDTLLLLQEGYKEFDICNDTNDLITIEEIVRDPHAHQVIYTRRRERWGAVKRELMALTQCYKALMPRTDIFQLDKFMTTELARSGIEVIREIIDDERVKLFSDYENEWTRVNREISIRVSHSDECQHGPITQVETESNGMTHLEISICGNDHKSVTALLESKSHNNRPERWKSIIKVSGNPDHKVGRRYELYSTGRDFKTSMGIHRRNHNYTKLSFAIASECSLELKQEYFSEEEPRRELANSEGQAWRERLELRLIYLLQDATESGRIWCRFMTNKERRDFVNELLDTSQYLLWTGRRQRVSLNID